MEIAVIILLLLLLGLNAFLFLRLKGKGEKAADIQGLVLLQNQIEGLTKSLDNRMAESTKVMHDSVRAQFGESAKLIKEVTEGLTKLDETNRQVVSFSEELHNLQDMLKNPKQRGILGEYYLETLLKNVLPTGSYQMQYGFPDGTIVDAAVFVKEKIIPVDSKFSLENYNRITSTSDPAEKERMEKTFVSDLKNRIVETSKYIQPEQGTMDFAFMFIPHEAIYYDLLVNKVGSIEEDTESLIERAARKYKVIIVSPTSFLAYLQTVLQGLKAMEIEEKAKDIVKRVGELGKHIKGYEEYHQKLGNALGTAVNQYNFAGKEFKKIDKDIFRLTGEKMSLETGETLEKPEREEE